MGLGGRVEESCAAVGGVVDGVLRRRVVADAEAAAISPYAVSAAACSASFLDRPMPLP